MNLKMKNLNLREACSIMGDVLALRMALGSNKGAKAMSSLMALRNCLILLRVMKRPNPLELKCDTITSPRRLVNTFIHRMIRDLLKRDKPIKVAINFKS
jgi:hypothetical protein